MADKQLSPKEREERNRRRADRFWEAFLFTENGKPKSSLIIYTFSLSLVFTAVYILCYEVSIRLLTGLLSSLPAFFSNLVIALVSSAFVPTAGSCSAVISGCACMRRRCWSLCWSSWGPRRTMGPS